MRRRIIVLVAVLVVSTCSKRMEALAAQDLALHYDVYYLALPIITLDVASRVVQGAYSTSVAVRTAGLLGFFAPWESQVTANGAIEGAVVRPTSYRAASAYRGRAQQIELEYGRAGAVQTAVHGVLSDGTREQVPDALRDGTLDPVSASALLTRRLAATGTCSGTIAIFDGLRRYDVRCDDLGTADLPPSRHDRYRGPARHCHAAIDVIAGELRSGESAELSAWLAPPVEGADPVTVRLDLESAIATLHVHLARVEPLVATP